MENTTENKDTKFCKHCGENVSKEAVVCVKCGLQIEELKQNATVGDLDNKRDKWISFLLCLFLGFLGAHKFYEKKIIFGIVYLLTGGLLGVGVLIDLILILLKPNPYYV